MSPEAREDYKRFFTKKPTKIYSYETRANSEVITLRQAGVWELFKGKERQQNVMVLEVDRINFCTKIERNKCIF